MSNGPTHRLTAAVTIGGYLLAQEANTDQYTLRPVIGGAIAAVATNLPDILEPASNPHHRQFFHSLVFAGALGYGTYKLYHWDPEEDWKQAARSVLLICAAAYFIHLALDAVTARSLPLVGKVA